MLSLKFCPSTWRLIMRFGFIAPAKQSTLATKGTSAFSTRSGMPFIRHGGHPLSRTVYGRMILCTFVVVAQMVLLLTGHDLGTIHGLLCFAFQICMTAARKRCRYPAPCHPSRFTMMMMRYDAGSVAGNRRKRSGGRPQRHLFAAQFSDINPQSWQQMMHQCQCGYDLAQL